MSTNSRIMISTPTAIYTVEKKVRENSRDGPAVCLYASRRELLNGVCMCEYYYAVIVTDFLMRAKKKEKKILKLLFFIRRTARSPYVSMCVIGYEYASVSRVKMNNYWQERKNIYNTAQESTEEAKKLSKNVLSFSFCLCAWLNILRCSEPSTHRNRLRDVSDFEQKEDSIMIWVCASISLALWRDSKWR